MELTTAANILVHYNKWRRLQAKETEYIRNNITEAMQKISAYVFINQEDNKELRTHAGIFDTYMKYRSGTLKEEPASFSTSIGTSIDFITTYILENHDQKHL